MRKALVLKGLAFAILMAFVLVMGAGCCGPCKKSVDEARMYVDQAKASASKAEAAADRAEAAAAKAEACLMKRMRK